MFKVYACLTQHHDFRLVLLAATVCLLSSAAAVSMLPRLTSLSGWRRVVWIAGASIVTGIGIWATHFVAMLAFEPNLRTGYDLGLTLLSLAAAITILGLAYSLASDRRFAAAPACGGAMVGLAIGVMHYLGMAAFEVEGHLGWDFGLVAASIVLGVAFGALALSVAHRGGGALRAQASAALLLTLAICGLHFTAMGAASIAPDPSVLVARSAMPDAWVAVGVTAGALALLIVSLAALLYDRQQRLGERRRLHELANAAVEGLVVCDEGVIVTANKSFETLIGAAEGQLIGTRLDALFDEGALEPLDGAEGARLETTLTSRSGEPIAVELIARTMPYGGKPHQGVAVRDLRARNQAEAQIRFLAHHDALTGLPNRAHFNERLEREFERHRRKGDAFAVLCLDLDRFKQVNDVFGHAAGDAVLQAVGSRVSELLDEDDVFARLGGDEFAIIRLGACRPGDLALLSEQILASLIPEFTLEDQSTLVGVSIGIALYPGDGDTPSTLIRNADAALYRAKEDGRGAYRFFEAGIGAELRERQVLEFDLRHAISRGELSVVYQPQTTIPSGEVFGFEALLRWNHSARGLVSPGVFIPIAEESGLILTIGEWVLRQACREAATWEKPLQVAVNLSGVQLHSASLASLVHEVLLETGLAPHRLELEITETALIQDFGHALHALRQIKALGVKIAMDDFGTGYSSLSNLRAFPFDKIKIDQSFVRNVHCNDQAAAIVRAIVGLARGLNLTVIAEGVESQAELEFLSNELCAEAQGFLFGKPGDISAFTTLEDEAEPARAAAG
ncbi:bifunctional diguanylate cyclase/phosphodiesterase [Phenylobacterium montanum]|uniref:EAL domain-containing protein n=1 Tax=Phenylobacterium montanum TaxID=2823693 RepID=A0A975IUH0_9CAUL|nr:EAL domain-containing protein [Caulobacter sp. S6]QUD87932.1 EAL domain-containing protein [Caulobacter sp. S6]